MRNDPARSNVTGSLLRDILAGLRASARQRLRDLSVRLQRTTPRERLLLAVLVMGALVYAPIAASDWRTTQEDRYVEAVTEQASARLAVAAARRVEAAASDRAALEDMKTWGFEATNAEVAAVEIERQLVQAATRVELPAFTIVADLEPEAIGATQWMGAEVQADLRWNPTFDFLDAVGSWPEGFRVTRFAYDVGILTPTQIMQGGAPVGGKVRLGLAFPVRLEETLDPGAPPTAAGSAAPLPGATP